MYTQVLRFNVCLHYASICLRITKRKFAQYDANKSISQGFTFIFIFILYVYIVVIWKISSDSSYTIETQSKRKYPRISSFSYGTKEVASIVRDTVNTYDGSDHTRHTLVIYLFMLLHNLFDDESEENIEDTVKINDTMRNDWRSLVPTITIYVAKESFFSNFMMPATFTQPALVCVFLRAFVWMHCASLKYAFSVLIFLRFSILEIVCVLPETRTISLFSMPVRA